MSNFWCERGADVVLVTGPDSLTYLQGQVSQDIRELADGQSTYSFVLQPTGKVEALVRIERRNAETFALDTDAGFGAALEARLKRFKIRVRVEITSATWRCIAVRESDRAIDGAVPAWGLDDAFDLLGDDIRPPDGIRKGDLAELELARIEAGWPAMGKEITEKTIPAETGHVVGRAVSFTKGCYPGQELVERMDSRGSAAPRFVRRLRGTGTTEMGAEIVHNAKPVGTVTSVVNTGDGWVALGSILRGVQPGDVVTVAGLDSVVEETSTHDATLVIPPRAIMRPSIARSTR